LKICLWFLSVFIGLNSEKFCEEYTSMYANVFGWPLLQFVSRISFHHLKEMRWL